MGLGVSASFFRGNVFSWCSSLERTTFSSQGRSRENKYSLEFRVWLARLNIFLTLYCAFCRICRVWSHAKRAVIVDLILFHVPSADILREKAKACLTEEAHFFSPEKAWFSKTPLPCIFCALDNSCLVMVRCPTSYVRNCQQPDVVE